MMRIITGSAKGIRLKTLEGDTTRPTAERVKEAVFSMLHGDVEGREVLDLFSGSGQMALEALSRGASRAVMLDSSPQAIRIISENANKTRLADKCDIKREDYLAYIRKSRGHCFDLIFLDPPYDSGFYTKALRALVDAEMLKPSSIIICESGESDIFGGNGTLAESFDVIKQTRYGRAFITILTPSTSKGEAE